MSRRRRNRPGRAARAVPKVIAATTASVPASPAADAFDGAYALLIQGKGGARRKVLLSLPAAERALARARREDRDAELVLVKLTVVGGERQ